MDTFVVGPGAREHAILHECLKSESVGTAYYGPGGNGGMSLIAEQARGSIDDFDSLVSFAKANLGKGSLTIVGPEVPLAKGIVDRFEREGLLILGPRLNAARVEYDKYFLKVLAVSSLIPTAKYTAFMSASDAKSHIQANYFRKGKGRCVVKANDLMAGKGVIVPKSIPAAFAAVDYLLAKSKDRLILVEEFLKGWECSFTVLTDGTTVLPLETATDYKRLSDGDEGPNTGGMGGFSPIPGLAPSKNRRFAPSLFDRMLEIMERIIQVLKNRGIIYKGFLYGGFMVTQDGNPMLLECNCRLGDPEAQIIIPPNFLELCYGAALGELKGMSIKKRDEALVNVVIASPGYPDNPQTGLMIYNLEKASKEGATIFHAATGRDAGGNFHTSGGRVLSVVGRSCVEGGNIEKALRTAKEMAYRAAGHISFGSPDPSQGKQCYRRDIAKID